MDKLRDDLQKQMGREVHINIQEISRPELDAQLVAENVPQASEVVPRPVQLAGIVARQALSETTGAPRRAAADGGGSWGRAARLEGTGGGSG